MRLRLLAVLAFAGPALAAAGKTYQITGPIVALTDTTITIQKGEERWEIARSPATRVEGTVAVGQRVTVHYRMSADRIDRIESKDRAAIAAEKADAAAEKAAKRAK